MHMKTQQLYDHYKTTFNQDFQFSVSSKDIINQITTLVFEPTEENAVLEIMHRRSKRL